MKRALALTLVLSLAPAVSWAQVPPFVVDARYAESVPWKTFSLHASGTVAVHLANVQVRCADPIPTRALPPEPACVAATAPGSSQLPADLVVHLFSRTGEVGTPLRCQRPSLSTGAQCDVSFGALDPGSYALLIHGGPNAQGEITAQVTLTSSSLDAPVDPDVRVSGNVVLSLPGSGTARYDVHSVLLPDGPTDQVDASGSLRHFPGNAANDFLGADATEIWVLDQNFRVVAADLAQTGVGAAARMNDVTHLRSVGAGTPAYALVRPWVVPPFYADHLTLSLGNDLPARNLAKDALFQDHVGAGRMRAVLNGGNDTDGDGLSDDVEAQLHLCDGIVQQVGRPGVDARACVTASQFRRGVMWMDPRDTDGDAISDGAEVLGTDVARAVPSNANGSCNTDPDAALADLANANETFPLWGFDPRHKDMLIEIDGAAASNTTCASPGTGCRGDGAVLPITQANNPNDTAGAIADLAAWHDHFSGLPATRVNNPDHRDGIEVHFDVRLPAVANQHGLQPQFLADPVGGERGGMIVYIPQARSPSSCSCAGQFSCIGSRHGGYAHYTLAQESGSGGASHCNNRIDFGLDPGFGPRGAHETGHHLGLEHGGPSTCNNNPFGAGAARDGDLGVANKLGYVSIMDYHYNYAPGQTFSLGQRAHYPLPRLQDDTLGFVERSTFGGLPTNPLALTGAQFPLGRLTQFGVAACDPRIASCTHTDFNFDGAFQAEPVRIPVNVGAGGAYDGPRHVALRIPHYWCGNENPPGLADDECCNAGHRISGTNSCTQGGMLAVPATDHTMLRIGSPALVVANHRFYAFFVDDVINDSNSGGSTPPRRCTQDDSNCTYAGDGNPGGWQPIGVLRWAAIDDFSGSGDPSRYPCTTSDGDPAHDCVVPRPNQLGDIVVDGYSDTGRVKDIQGNTLLAATTIPGVAGGPDTIYFGWVQRGEGQPGESFSCRPGIDCDLYWSTLHLTYGAGDQIEGRSGGLRTANIDLTPMMHGTVANVSGLAMATWNPTDGGATKAAVLVRDARTRQVFWSVCGADGNCTQVAPLSAPTLDPGLPAVAPVSSQSALAASVEDGVDGVRRLVVGYSRPDPRTPVPGQLLRPPLITLLRVSPSANSFADVASFATPITFPDPVNVELPIARDGAMSMAFTAAGRLVLNYQDGNGAGSIAVHVSSLVSAPFDHPPPGQPHAVVLRLLDPGIPTESVVNAGGLLPAFVSAPGSVPAIALDTRDGIVDDPTRIGHLLHRIRSIRATSEQNEIVLQFDAIADGEPDAPRYDYDDSQTLAFELCQTIESTSRGAAGADLRALGSSLGPFTCPSGLDWIENSGAIANVLGPAIARCRTPGCRRPSPELIAAVADYISDPALAAAPRPAFRNAGPGLPLLPPGSAPYCAVGQTSEAYQMEAVACVTSKTHDCSDVFTASAL